MAKGFHSEDSINDTIKHFQKVLGIVDEAEIVSNDDYERTYLVNVEDFEGGKAIV